MPKTTTSTTKATKATQATRTTKAPAKKAVAKTTARASKKTGLEWLRERMDVLGYRSLEEVAQQIGINRGNLYRYFSLETRPSVALLPDLCHALDCSPAEVLKALEILRPNDSL
jgi:transcriptional regulator with XRE-family HTH domain